MYKRSVYFHLETTEQTMHCIPDALHHRQFLPGNLAVLNSLCHGPFTVLTLVYNSSGAPGCVFRLFGGAKRCRRREVSRFTIPSQLVLKSRAVVDSRSNRRRLQPGWHGSHWGTVPLRVCGGIGDLVETLCLTSPL